MQLRAVVKTLSISGHIAGVQEYRSTNSWHDLEPSYNKHRREETKATKRILKRKNDNKRPLMSCEAI